MLKNIKFFNENGFILVKKFFQLNRINEVINWVDKQDLNSQAKSWTEKEPGVSLAVWSWVNDQDSPLAKLVKDESILEYAGILINSEVYLWASKVNFKAAWCGTVEYYHQDLIYWKDRGYEKDDMLSCMIFLDKHELSNAALHIFPGSHKSGLLEHKFFTNINGLAKLMVPPERLKELHEKHPNIYVEAEPGDVLFFHSLLVHGSSHNISSKSRRIALSQINSKNNIPQSVQLKAKEFNLKRAKFEVDEAKRKYEWFLNKYNSQKNSDEILFSAPIPKEEKNNAQ